MKLPELAETLRERLLALDHPEIVDVVVTLSPENVSKAGFGCPIVRIDYASGAQSYISGYAARGPGIPSHQPYALPREAY